MSLQYIDFVFYPLYTWHRRIQSNRTLFYSFLCQWNVTSGLESWNIELILFTWQRQNKSLLQVICVSLPLRRKIVGGGTVIFEKLTGGISLTFCNKESYACVAPGHRKPVSLHTAQGHKFHLRWNRFFATYSFFYLKLILHADISKKPVSHFFLATSLLLFQTSVHSFVFMTDLLLIRRDQL